MSGFSGEIQSGSAGGGKRKGSGSPAIRSRVTNRNAILPDVDGRTMAARRYRDIFDQLVSDMGGDPSEARIQLARRASNLAVWCEQVEADMARGQGIDIGEYTTATNALRRHLVDLGLERRAKDVTPTLSEYMRRSRHTEAA